MNSRSWTDALGALAVGACLASCSDDLVYMQSTDVGVPVEVQFALRHAGRDVGCGDVLTDLGMSRTSAELRDARLYVHDVQLVLSSGEVTPLQLEDSFWQRMGVALLDFADDTGLCDTGSPETNSTLVGRYAGAGHVEGVRFRVGLPEELNHLDSARAPAPLNAPGMAWSWVGGFKYARIDVKSEGNDSWYIHLGATNCEGSPAEGIECARANVAEVSVEGLDLSALRVGLDLDRVYAGSDLDAPLTSDEDSVPGCMAFGGDPECGPIFEAFGMGFESDSRAPATCFAAVGAP